MKKTGFTLAEVLITLTIIGVIATLTLPTLMTNTAERQYVTGLKKVINTLSEAGQTNAALAGFDYGTITDATPDSLTNAPADGEQSVYALLFNRTNLDFQKNGTALPAGGDGEEISGAEDRTIYFRDGSAIVLSGNDITVEGGAVVNGGIIEAVVDVNGAKGPNIISTCQGAADVAFTANAENAGDGEGEGEGEGQQALDLNAAIAASANRCADQTTRLIRDRFRIRLDGANALPNNAAAQWAFDN